MFKNYLYIKNNKDMNNYLNAFETEQEFLDFKNSSGFSNNTVSYVEENSTIWYGSIKRTPIEIENMAEDIINNIINTER